MKSGSGVYPTWMYYSRSRCITMYVERAWGNIFKLHEDIAPLLISKEVDLGGGG